MTTIAKDVAAKLSVAVVAVAMALSAFAVPAQAQTTEELQQMINDLLAQVAQLQGQVGQGSTGVASGVCPFSWTRDLSSGSTGADVMKLQQFLNADPDTRVAAEGAGSVGSETEYFGPATGAAVSKFQVKYRSEILSPAGLVNPTAYFGPSSRAKANMLCSSAPSTGDDMDDDDMMDDDDDSSSALEGEGTLAKFEIDDDEDEVQEGEEDVPVMVLTLEAEDGDIEISRLTFTIVADTGTTNEEDEPWDVFEEFSLWVDGDKVADFDASDEDEYLDEDAGEFRFSNLDIVLREDDETEIVVAVSAMNSVDGSDVSNAADWNLEPTEVRYFDADGVAETEDSVDEMTSGADAAEQVHFDIVEEGVDDMAEIESSSDNPDSATLKVDDGSDDSDEYTVHIFEIEVDEDSSDLEVGDAYADVTIGGVAIPGGQEDVIDEITMTIDGVTVEGEATAMGADEEDDAITATTSTVVRYLFEFDGDVDLEADETYDVEINMVFKGQDGNYNNGATVETSVTGSQWEVEGLANDDELEGSDSSEQHTLADSVPVISGVDSEVSADDPNDSGRISFEFNVEADDEDVTLDVADNADVNGATDDVMFTVTGTDTGIATAALTKIDGDATYSTSTGKWTINDGDDATFALDVTFTTASSADDGTYRVTLDSVGGVDIDETSAGLSLSN